MERPTAATVRALTPAPPNGTDYAEYGYPAPAGQDPDPLQAEVDVAIQYVEQVTGRIPIESVPPELEAIARKAIRMATEQVILTTTGEAVESAVDSEVVSFTAGSYSETRRTDRGHKKDERWINPWGALDELLWLLMTPEKREEWEERLSGNVAPAFGVTVPDWSAFATGDFPSVASKSSDAPWPWTSDYPDTELG